MQKDLTIEELAALHAYAAQHGRTWKARLNDDWFYARTTGVLQVLRNTRGPRWLASFKLTEAR